MDGASKFFVIALIALVALFVWGRWLSARYEREHEITVDLTEDEVLKIVRKTFPAFFWGAAPGPGDLNKRFRSFSDNGATISIDIEKREGQLVVRTWLSDWETRFAMVASPGANGALRLARRLARA